MGGRAHAGAPLIWAHISLLISADIVIVRWLSRAVRQAQENSR
jgi:hypothetical protein